MKSSESKICWFGFALALDPEILNRVKRQAYEAGLIGETALKPVCSESIDELFMKFPIMEYKRSEHKDKSLKTE